MDHRHAFNAAMPRAEHVAHHVDDVALPCYRHHLAVLPVLYAARCMPSCTGICVARHLTARHAGDVLDVKVHRKGEEVALRYRLHQRRPLVPVLHGVDCVPSYLIVGGLVFVPLSIPFLEHAYGGALAPPLACFCEPCMVRMQGSSHAWCSGAEHASMPS